MGKLVLAMFAVLALCSCGKKEEGKGKAPEAGGASEPSKGFESPRAAWEEYRKRTLENDWEGIWQIYSDRMREGVKDAIGKQKEQWESRGDKSKKEEFTRLTYEELLKMDSMAIFLAMGKARGDKLMKEDDPAGWSFVSERTEGDWAEVTFANAKGRKGREEFAKTAAGWKMDNFGQMLRAKETAAQSNLRSFLTAETVFQDRGIIDVDGDGSGEFGFMAELAGTVALRNGGEALKDDPFLSPRNGEVNEKGVATRSGYCFIIYLPTGEKGGTASDPKAVDPSLAARNLVAYAWPEERGLTGRWAYAVDATGVVYRLKGDAWSGAGNPPPWHALYYGGEEATWNSKPDEEKWSLR